MNIFEKNKPEKISDKPVMLFFLIIAGLLFIYKFIEFFYLKSSKFEIFWPIVKDVLVMVGALFAYHSIDESRKRDELSRIGVMQKNYFDHKKEFLVHVKNEEELFEGIEINKLYVKFFPRVIRGEYAVDFQYFLDGYKSNEEIKIILKKYELIDKNNEEDIKKIIKDEASDEKSVNFAKNYLLDAFEFIDEKSLFNSKAIFKSLADFYPHNVDYDNFNKLVSIVNDLENLIHIMRKVRSGGMYGAIKNSYKLDGR